MAAKLRIYPLVFSDFIIPVTSKEYNFTHKWFYVHFNNIIYFMFQLLENLKI
jgi:hypothetical protein